MVATVQITPIITTASEIRGGTGDRKKANRISTLNTSDPIKETHFLLNAVGHYRPDQGQSAQMNITLAWRLNPAA